MTIIARENTPLLPFQWTPEGEAVQFKLRGLTTGEALDVQALAELDAENKQMRWTRRAVLAGLQAGLLGWDGLKYASGEPVAFSAKAADNVERLRITLTMQLFGQIMGATGLNGEQAKN